MFADIIEKKETIQVGSGEYDRIGITRVTRKKCGCSRYTAVMVPGAFSDFNTTFSKMAKYLAARDVDVWGMDLRYAFVPDDLNTVPYCQHADCSFMKDWNTDMHISDIDRVVKMAELSSTDRVFLIGFSQGAYFAYRYASQHPDLKGIVAMDIAYNLDPALTDLIARTKAEVDANNAKMQSGIYYEDNLAVKTIAGLAYSDPEGPSPVIPDMTNRQAALFAITATYQLEFSVPNYRYAQGDITGLKYSDYNFVLEQAMKLKSFQSIVPTTELYTQWIQESPQIPDIRIPLLYVGAEFGFGEFGLYTPGKVKTFNKNVSVCFVNDYGHGDLVYAENAKYDVWTKILKWIISGQKR